MSAPAVPTVRIQAEDFDTGAEIARLTGGRTDIGAVVSFSGLCRDEAGQLSALELEHYPGMAEAEIARIAERRVNVVSVDHHREGMDLPVTGTAVELTLSTRDEEHCDELLGFLAEWGYEAERVR